VLQRVTSARAEEAALVVVGVHVGDCAGRKLRGVRFGPLRRADEPGFLGIPARIDQRARDAAPVCMSAPIARASLSIAAWPESGSQAPNTQASR
jgi:hypothetical protein